MHSSLPEYGELDVATVTCPEKIEVFIAYSIDGTVFASLLHGRIAERTGSWKDSSSADRSLARVTVLPRSCFSCAGNLFVSHWRVC